MCAPTEAGYSFSTGSRQPWRVKDSTLWGPGASSLPQQPGPRTEVKAQLHLSFGAKPFSEAFSEDWIGKAALL